MVMTSASVRAASPPQPAIADDISERVRHGEIDGDQLEFHGHGGIVKLAASDGTSLRRRVVPC